MFYFAHRGDSNNYPENTMLAFAKAVAVGAAGIELDVHKTKDDQLVVIHDEDVQRTFCGKGLVKDFTLKELKHLKCRKDLFRNDRRCIIPTLEEVMILLKEKEMVLNIELKTDNIHYDYIERDVIEMIHQFDMTERIILSSFNHESLVISKAIDPTIKTGVLYGKPIENIVAYAKQMGAYAIHPYLPLVSQELIEEAHRENLRVNIYTVNHPEEMRLCRLTGVDSIFTDYPGLCKEVLEDEVYARDTGLSEGS